MTCRLFLFNRFSFLSSLFFLFPLLLCCVGLVGWLVLKLFGGATHAMCHLSSFPSPTASRHHIGASGDSNGTQARQGAEDKIQTHTQHSEHTHVAHSSNGSRTTRLPIDHHTLLHCTHTQQQPENNFQIPTKQITVSKITTPSSQCDLTSRVTLTHASILLCVCLVVSFIRLAP